MNTGPKVNHGWAFSRFFFFLPSSFSLERNIKKTERDFNLLDFFFVFVLNFFSPEINLKKIKMKNVNVYIYLGFARSMAGVFAY